MRVDARLGYAGPHQYSARESFNNPLQVIKLATVRLLSMYLLRQLAAPFIFALTALTSLMLLSQIAKKFGSLVGKGLPWTVIAEVFALSIPFIVAMTLPMAVLLAVLYAFSHLAADNEITAMRASGVSVYQILVPVLAWGVFMSAFNFAFVDQVLPRSNARLRNLLIDIGRKKPTFELQEQVINEVPPSQYFLRANRIDGATGRLREVTIYDVGGDASRRIIYADSGLMAYAEGQTDLSLRLFDGSIHQFRPVDPTGFQLTYFRVNDIRVKNVFDELERNTSESVRGDREMSTCEMLDVIRDADREEVEALEDRRHLLVDDLRILLALPRMPEPDSGPAMAPAPAYCGWIQRATQPRPSQDGGGPGHHTGHGPPGRRRTASGPAQGGAGQGDTGQPGRDRHPAHASPPCRTPGAVAFQLVAHRHRPRPRTGRGAPGRPVRGRGAQEVGDQPGVHLLRDRRDRDGAPVPARAGSAW